MLKVLFLWIAHQLVIIERKVKKDSDPFYVVVEEAILPCDYPETVCSKC